MIIRTQNNEILNLDLVYMIKIINKIELYAFIYGQQSVMIKRYKTQKEAEAGLRKIYKLWRENI